MEGFFFIKNVISLFELLQTRYPHFISKSFAIGSTVQGRDIPAFTLGLLSNPVSAGDQTKRQLEKTPDRVKRTLEDELSSAHQKHKSNILFTGLHHAREPLTLSMIVYIFLANLHVLINTNWETVVRVSNIFKDDVEGQLISEKFFLFGNFIFVPAVNLDSYVFINESYGTPSWKIAKNKRKNMDMNTPCETTNHKNNPELVKKVHSGVDINRNYDIMFDKDDVGSVDDPCDETYRGE